MLSRRYRGDAYVKPIYSKTICHPSPLGRFPFVDAESEGDRCKVTDHRHLSPVIISRRKRLHDTVLTA